MDEQAVEIVAKAIGYINDEQKAFALSAARMYVAALKDVGFEIVKREEK